jgi:KDO2-lipid IV(A) lauroyltransferase
MANFLDNLGFYAFKVFSFFLLLLPRSLRRSLFINLSKLAYLIAKKHRRIIKQNLDFTFGDEMDEIQKTEIAKYCFKNLTLALFQVIENQRLTSKDLSKMLTFENDEHLKSLIEQKRPIVFIAAHFGNWELGATGLASQVIATNAVHKALNQKLFDNYLFHSREKFNMTMVEKNGAIKNLNKALTRGETVSLLIDQNVNPKESVIVKFFNQDITMTPATAFLARKHNAAIIPLLIFTDDHKNFTIKFYDEITVAQSDDKSKDILEASQKQSDWLEAQIRKDPKYWFWCHRRFKSTHPEIYNKDA